MSRSNFLTLAAPLALVFAICILQIVVVAAEDPPFPVSKCHDVIARSASGKTRRLNLDWMASQVWSLHTTRDEKFHVSVCENMASCEDSSVKTGVCGSFASRKRSIGVWPAGVPKIIFDENASPQGSIVMETEVVNGEKTRLTVHCFPYAMFSPGNISYVAPRPNTPGVRVHHISFSHRDACGLDPLTPIPGMCSNIVASTENGQKKAQFNLDELSQVTIFRIMSAYDFDADLETVFGVCNQVDCHHGYQPLLPTRMVGACTGVTEEHRDPSEYVTTAMYSSNPRDLKFTWINEGLVGGALRIDLPIHQQKYKLSIVILCDPDTSDPAFAHAASSPHGSPDPWRQTITLPHRAGCGRPL